MCPIRHGRSYSDTYRVWMSMKQRCTNSNNSRYKDYGGRGIIVCARWLNNFLNFLEDMGERPEGLTLDRINNNGNYEPDNCRWTTYSIQNKNRRDYNVGPKLKEYCPKGHMYSGANLYIDTRGHQQCKACIKEVQQRYRINQIIAQEA